MGYVGPSLAHAFDISDSVERLCRDIAEEGGDRMTGYIRELTPVGLSPFEANYVPGHLRESIAKKLVVVVVTPNGIEYRTGTETDVEYSVYVENGTGLWGPARSFYEIRPKNPDGWLRFYDKNGNAIFAKRVLHPGSPGAHMFARGVALTESSLHVWAQAKVDAWAAREEVAIALRGREAVLVS